MFTLPEQHLSHDDHFERLTIQDLSAIWHTKLTDLLLTKGAAEQDGSYYAAAINDDTYVMITNYATAGMHVNYRIDSDDRSQRTSLETGDPIITVEFRHIHTDDVKQGYVIFQQNTVRKDSLLGLALKNTANSGQNNDNFIILSTSDLTEVSAREALNSPLHSLLQNIN